MPMRTLQRRGFLRMGAVATATLLARCARSPSQQNSEVVAKPSSGPIRLQTYSSEAGRLRVEISAKPQTVSIGDRPANLLTYNGQIPGPLLEAKPGDTVQLNFTNQLTQPTNLHFHGLHIPPTGSGDDVFLEIPPGGQHTYEFQIPSDHPAGTFWYHPHYHGLVAEQLFGGLAGLFIVRGPLDDIPEIKAAKESFLVLKDYALDRQGNIPSPGHMAQMRGRMGDVLTASGQINPALSIAPGGLLRLRLLNASSSRYFQLSLAAHELYLIATDGGAIAAPIPLSQLMLAPGERAEVLVKGDQSPGEYRLFNQPFNPARGIIGGGSMGDHMGGTQPSGRAETVATLSYSREAESVPLPTQLIPVVALPEAQTTRQFTLNHGMTRGMGGGMVFLINGQAFDHARVDTQVQLGTIEDWEIINTGTMAHPFHVHVNKFQIVSRNDQPSPYTAWKDVVSISPGERVKLRMAFRDYAGKTVYHCHVLDHEDLGMMGTLEILAEA